MKKNVPELENIVEIFGQINALYIKPYYRTLIYSLILMFIVALCNAIIVTLVQPIIDSALIAKDREMLVLLPVMILLIALIKGIAEYGEVYYARYTIQKVMNDLQLALYKHLLESDVMFIQKQGHGRLISRFSNDLSLLEASLINLLTGFVKHFLSVLFVTIAMINLEPFLSLLVIVAFPLAIYPVHQIGKKIRYFRSNSQKERADYASKMDETLSSIKIVKSYQAEDFEAHRAKRFLSNIFSLYQKSLKIDALVSPITEILSGAVVGGVILYGGALVIDGVTTVGALFAFISAFLAAYRPFKSLLMLNVHLQDTVVIFRRILEIINHDVMIKDKKDAIDLDNIDGEIEFQNVSLAFSGINVLNDLNLKIKTKTTVAIVGNSGGGKTSIANLILRFYECGSGKIMIDNHDIADIKLSSLRSNIALVSQDVMLFEGTIADNISYSSTGKCNFDDIESAAKAAYAHDFIMKMSSGYNTVIAPHGKNLSGGQKQCIAIARAFLKNAPIIILDEATSGLDPATDSNLRDVLTRLCENRTTIIITHKLSTIKNVDQIYLVEHGKIIEQGTHETLIKYESKYNALYAKYI